MKFIKKRAFAASGVLSLFIATSIINPARVHAAECSIAPDKASLKVSYSSLGSNPVFTVLPASTGEPAKRIKLFYSILERGKNEWGTWTEQSEWLNVDSTILAKGFRWDSSEIENSEEGQLISISASLWNECGITNIFSSVYTYQLGVQDWLGNPIENNIKMFSDILIVNAYRLNLIERNQYTFTSITPSVCKAIPAENVRTNNTSGLFTAEPLSEGICSIKITSTDSVVEFSVVHSFVLVKSPVYHLVDFGRFTTKGSVNSFVFLSGNYSPNISESLETASKYKFALKVLTPSVCASTVDKSKLAIALKLQSFKIKGLKVGNCVLQITDPETTTFSGASYKITIPFSMGKPFNFNADYDQFCTRVVGRAIFFSGYKFSCPNGYYDSRSGSPGFTLSQVIPRTPSI